MHPFLLHGLNHAIKGRGLKSPTISGTPGLDLGQIIAIPVPLILNKERSNVTELILDVNICKYLALSNIQ